MVLVDKDIEPWLLQVAHTWVALAQVTVDIISSGTDQEVGLFLGGGVPSDFEVCVRLGVRRPRALADEIGHDGT